MTQFSLFIGNLSSSVNEKDLETEFRKFGECQVELMNKYAFVTYKMEKDSEIAKNEMHQTILAGLPIIVEWSKKSARFLENEIKPRLFKNRTDPRNRQRTYGDRFLMKQRINSESKGRNESDFQEKECERSVSQFKSSMSQHKKKRKRRRKRRSSNQIVQQSRSQSQKRRCSRSQSQKRRCSRSQSEKRRSSRSQSRYRKRRRSYSQKRRENNFQEETWRRSSSSESRRRDEERREISNQNFRRYYLNENDSTYDSKWKETLDEEDQKIQSLLQSMKKSFSEESPINQSDKNEEQNYLSNFGKYESFQLENMSELFN